MSCIHPLPQSMPSPVQTRAVGDVFVITIDSPPVNAISVAVRAALICAMEEFNHSELNSAVLIGSGGLFLTGADIREFDGPPQLPSLLDVVRSIASCNKPVVAALQGVVLGGGLELALACDVRIAHEHVSMGFPEVSLGIIPGAGGTQLLTRKIGVSRAVDMICCEKRLTAEQAKSWNLVDEVVSSNLLQESIRFAGETKKKSKIENEKAPGEESDLHRQLLEKYKFSRASQPAIDVALELIQKASELPLEEGLELEKVAFLKLKTSPEAQALRYVFFAERACKKSLRVRDVESIPINEVCVIGAGTMGIGIAICLLDVGYSVMLLDQNEDALDNALKRIRDHYQKKITSGNLSSIKASELLNHLSCLRNWEEISKANLIIEAVYEDLEIKKEVFRKMDQFANSNAIFGTNTSYLDVDEIAAATSRAQRVMGLHFFSPAHSMKLLEVVNGRCTSSEVLQAGIRLGSRLNKYVAVTKNCFGFVGNRIYNAYRTQCEFMLEDGVLPEEIDEALVKFGMAMGPFAVADLSGLDIAWRMRKSRQPKQGSRYVDILDTLCELGRFGRKTGSGYYDYIQGERRAHTGDLVRQIVEDASRRRGIARQKISVENIQKRALLSMVNEAALLMHEGVIERASDIDLVLIHGYGFPRWRGGPIFWAHQQNIQQLQEDIRSLVQHDATGFIPADISILYAKSS